MAYGNWGAWVFRDGVFMPNWCDQTPYREESEAAGYHQVFMRTSDGLSPHHAVLGCREVRWCGYKNWPVLFHRLEKIETDAFITSPLPEELYGEHEYEGKIDGEAGTYRFSAVQFDGNMIDLFLLEPDGVKWQARCGYEYGSGFDDVPRNDSDWPW